MKTFEQFMESGTSIPTHASVQHVDKGTDSHSLIVKSHNTSLSLHLNPKHLNTLRSLGDYDETHIKDHRGVTWHVKRDNGQFHATSKSHPPCVHKFPIHHAD